MARIPRLGLLGPCILCFLFLLGACSSQAPLTTVLYSQQLSRASVQTSCPVTGSGRAAVMPSIQLGSHPSIVYAYSPGNTSIIRRYDTVTHTKTDIITLANPNHFASVQMLRVSPDGQWITFQSRIGQLQAIQMVHIDGKYFQTLYCTPQNSGIGSLLMSPDQKYILFGEYKQTFTTYLLRLATGKVQTELLPQKNSGIGYEPVKWLTNKSVVLGLTAYTPWSTVSRNGSQYVVQVNNYGNNVSIQTLSFGSFNGGQPTSFASADDNVGEVVLAGWTTF